MKKLLYILLITICYLATLTNSFTIHNDGDVVEVKAEAPTQVNLVLVEDSRSGISSTDLEKVFTISAYNTVIEQCSGDPCISASGKNICGRNDTVACPRKYKFGTKFEILDKIYICEDRLALKYNNRIDINFDKDMVGAKNWGVKTLLVKIKL